MTPSTTADSSGQVAPELADLIPGYTLVEKLGRGGMGTVYRARQKSMDRWVAIKLLKPELAKEDPGYVQRFIAEARTAGKLRHENLVAGLDCGDVRGQFYMVMEFVEGRPLDSILKERGVLPEGEALSIARQVAEALQHAWEFKIVHRDVKPQNILITKSGTAKLCDLGLARVAGAGTNLTLTGHVHCTPSYASPEQARGRKDLDARSDIYSLGVTLYHLLTGTLPFTGEAAGELFIKHATEKPAAPLHRNPRISAAANQLVLWMMEKDRERRPATPAAVAAKIREIQAGGSRASAAVPRRPRERRRTSSAPSWIGWAIGAGIAVAGTAIVLVATSGWREPPPPPVAERRPVERPEVSEKPKRPETKSETPRKVEEPRTPETTTKKPEDDRNARFDEAFARAEKFAGEKNWAKALEALEEALRIRAGDPKALELRKAIETARRDAAYDEAMTRAEEHRGRKEWSKALEALEAALKAKPGDARAAQLRQTILADSLEERYAQALALAEKLAKEKDWSGALAALEGALKLRPGDARALELQKQVSSAQREQLYREALALGEGHLKAKRYRDAIAAFQGALALKPNDSKANDGIARARTAGAKDPTIFEELKSIPAHENTVTAVDIHPKEPLFLSAGLDNKVKVWDAAKGRELRVFTGPTGGIDEAIFSLDGGTILACSRDGHVRFWDTASGKEKTPAKFYETTTTPIELYGIAMSRDYKLAVVGRWNEVFQYDFVKQEYLPRLRGHGMSAVSAKYSPTGKYLATGGVDGTVIVWDYAGCVAAQTLSGHTEAAAALAFSPDGKLLASGSDDKTVRIWSMPDGRHLHTLKAHAGKVRGLAFSPDGRFLVSASGDATIRIWDPSTGAEVGKLAGHASIGPIAFSPEGKILLTGLSDKTLRVWGVKK